MAVLDRGSVKDVLFFSKALQEELQLYVYVPANYTPLQSYNLLIASDGNDYFQLGGITRVADELINDYEIEELIIVFVPYKNAADRREKYVPGGEKYEAYLTFLTAELMPYLESNYSIEHDPAGRGLIGDSMAATISLMGAITHPDIFGKAILQSPYVDEQVFEAVKNFNEPDKVSIYHIIGKQEDEVVTMEKKVEDFLTPNRELHELMKEKDFPVFYSEFNGNHTWKYWKPDLKRALVHNFS